ncbi:MAG: galactose/methyl galactoside transporter ATP-binding protein MglA [Firmicutes bacterium]|nr:galactose/methyl galactoside transporter ATP-binding protein MglA [Bacillota bacterium]
MTTSSPYLLEMIDITKDFPGVKALDGVTLRLRPGTVHALMGENGAGKSTLMKCLFGIYHADAGEILLDGQNVQFATARQALDHGVSMVHQELNQVRQRDVMENIWLGRFPLKGLLVDHKRMYEQTLEIFRDLDIAVDPREQVQRLSVSQRQMVEIAKAVSYNARVIAMDEPTSSLTEKEVAHLFRIINSLRNKGCGIIYISHKMEEILRIADDVTIMRDGKWIETRPASELTTDEIIRLMVGRDLSQRFPPKESLPGEVILQVEGLTATVQPSLRDVSFDLRKGEILGIAGLVGSKRTDIVESLFGIRHLQAGRILLHGRAIQNGSPDQAMQNGFALVTEERRLTGIFPLLSVHFNAVVASLKRYVRPTGLLAEKQAADDTDWVLKSLSVKTPSPKTPIGSLSGGNQQKVILGRWLLTKPEILMLDEPTRGIDVGAKYEIYQLMVNLTGQGKGIIMISSEMPELLGVTDRILVMSNGRVAGILNTRDASQEELLRLAAKYL